MELSKKREIINETIRELQDIKYNLDDLQDYVNSEEEHIEDLIDNVSFVESKLPVIILDLNTVINFLENFYNDINKEGK